jgi:methionine-R-sulfoxide reductase
MINVARAALGAVLLGLALFALYAPRGTAVNPDDVAFSPDARIGRLRPDDSTLRASLTPLQYRVTQRQYTEPAFDNPFHGFEGDGIYVDVVSGEPLFSSEDKLTLPTGWPVFTRPLEPANVYTRRVVLMSLERSELRSVGADSHLGHLLADPADPSTLHYRVNSAALRFIPADSLEPAGYARYRGRFFEEVTDSDTDADEPVSNRAGSSATG